MLHPIIEKLNNFFVVLVNFIVSLPRTYQERLREWALRRLGNPG